MQIIPAVLTDNKPDLIEKIKSLAEIFNLVQIDIMDGVFVDNKSVSLSDIDALPDLLFEIHLMVKNPVEYLADCERIGAKRVFVHIESVDDMQELLARSVLYDFSLGLAVNPQTPLTKIFPFVPDIDWVLILGVEPGRQGQEFIGSTLDKVATLKKYYPSVLVEVDGGVKPDNIAAIKNSGADAVAVGSFIINSSNKGKAYQQLLSALNN